MAEAKSSQDSGRFKPHQRHYELPDETGRVVTPEEMACAFHEAYESLAEGFGYRTREASAVPWEAVPENNKALMIATVRNVLIEQGLRLR